jgi:PTH1 family peptidyl-tRNA hydrolase
MKVIIGFGNPEARYNDTRHNTGFAVVDTLAKDAGKSFQVKDKFKAHVAEGSIGAEKVLLVKPLTFYNESGQSYRAIVDFYKLEPSDVLIIHDELSLPFGTVRTRTGGSDAGNNGIKSINTHGGDKTARIRVGVGNERRSVMGDTDFVLGKLSKDEHDILHEQLMPKIFTSIESFISGSFEPTSFSLMLDQTEE